MAIEAERLLAIFEAKFTSLDKALAKARGDAQTTFGSIEAAGTRAENALAQVGSRGTPGFDKLTKSIQNTKIQTGNLAAQLNDIGVQLAGGQSPFLIAIQQGTQINQALGEAGAKGAITALGGAFASLINPVGLATIAIITLGGAAIQYFASVLSGGEKSAETLQREAELIQQVAAKWGDALPGIKAYADEKARLAEQENIQKGAQAVIEGSFEGARTSIEAVRSDLKLLIDDLSTMAGKEADVGKLQAAFTSLDGKVADQTATAEDAKAVQAALADVQVSTGIPAANALAAAFGNLAIAIGTASAAADKARVDAAQAAQVLSPLGTVPPVFSGGGKLIDENQLQSDRANATKSQFQIAQEKLARKGSGRKGKTEAEREAEAVAKLVDQLEFEYSMIGKTDEERKVANALRRAGSAATDEQKQQIASLVVAIDQERDATRAAADASDFLKESLADAFTDLIPQIETGNKALDNLLNTLIAAVAQAALLGQGPLRGLFGGTGLLSGIGAGGILGGAIIPGILHRGGVAGSDGYGHGRSVSPSVFAGARRMHSGGVAGLRSGEVPAILKRGEVVTPAGVSPGGSAPQQVTVHLVGEEGEMFVPRVTQISGQTASVVVTQSRPQLAQDAEATVRHSQRNNPGRWR